MGHIGLRQSQGNHETLLRALVSVLQSRPSDLGAVVKGWKQEFPGLQYVYAWHALHAYWNGVCPTEAGTKKYGSVIMHPRPTPGNLEIDPSMAWSAAVLNGVGTVSNPEPLHGDMHAYLQGEATPHILEVGSSTGI